MGVVLLGNKGTETEASWMELVPLQEQLWEDGYSLGEENTEKTFRTRKQAFMVTEEIGSTGLRLPSLQNHENWVPVMGNTLLLTPKQIFEDIESHNLTNFDSYNSDADVQKYSSNIRAMENKRISYIHISQY